MRFYNTVKELHSEIRRDLKEMGIAYDSKTVQDQTLQGGDDAHTLELCPYDYTLFSKGGDPGTLMTEIMEIIQAENPNKAQWVMEEASERCQAHLLPLEDRNPGFAWKSYESFWGKFLHDGKFSYQYADRIGGQFPKIVKTLEDDPNSRQAIMTIYHPSDLENNGGKKRVPCSLQYHFLIRNGRMKMMYYQRSCDFSKFFLPDVLFALSMGWEIAGRLGVKFESLTHVISSLHVFYNDVKEVF